MIDLRMFLGRTLGKVLIPLMCACGQTTITVSGAGEPEPTDRSDPGPPQLGGDSGASRPGQEASDPDASMPEAEPDLGRGLLAHFTFDESELGSVIADQSSNGHDGVPSANPPTPALSVPPVGFDNPRSLSFDGATQLIDLGNPETLNLSGPVTISAWIRPLALDGYRNVVAHGFRFLPSHEISLRISDGYYEFTVWDGEDHWARAPVPVGDIDSWHHLVGTYDGSIYRLYRDSQLLAETADSVGPTKMDAPWAIGGRSGDMPAEDRFFHGLVDEVRIYGRALSATELQALFR